LATDVTLRPPP